jgi:hypothetical protein
MHVSVTRRPSENHGAIGSNNRKPTSRSRLARSYEEQCVVLDPALKRAPSLADIEIVTAGLGHHSVEQPAQLGHITANIAHRAGG